MGAAAVLVPLIVICENTNSGIAFSILIQKFLQII